jgi:hypothetical protein
MLTSEKIIEFIERTIVEDYLSGNRMGFRRARG